MNDKGRGVRGEGREPLFEGMALLLDAYFHEDFRTEFGDHEAAAGSFAREASMEELDAASSALGEFVQWAERRERAEWQAALVRTGGAWRPRSLEPVREVLKAVSGQRPS